MSMSRAVTASTVVALTLALCAAASAAGLPTPMALSDDQLDRIAGGATSSADGTGRANGKLAQTDVAVTSEVGAQAPSAAGPTIGSAVGTVTANALAAPGALATASSFLSLTVAMP
jgi:hypothetical protein